MPISNDCVISCCAGAAVPSVFFNSEPDYAARCELVPGESGIAEAKIAGCQRIM